MPFFKFQSQSEERQAVGSLWRNSGVPLNAKLIRDPFLSLLIQFQSQFSNFLLGANVHPPKRKTTTATSPIRLTTQVASHRMCQNGVMSSTFGHFS